MFVQVKFNTESIYPHFYATVHNLYQYKVIIIIIIIN